MSDSNARPSRGTAMAEGGMFRTEANTSSRYRSRCALSASTVDRGQHDGPPAGGRLRRADDARTRPEGRCLFLDPHDRGCGADVVASTAEEFAEPEATGPGEEHGRDTDRHHTFAF